MRFSMAVVLFLALAVVECGKQTPVAKCRLNRAELREAQDTIDWGIKVGLIKKVTPELNEVCVDPAFWKVGLYDDKVTYGQLLARYCATKTGSDSCWVEIKDCDSGKVLAEYSESSGFRGY